MAYSPEEIAQKIGSGLLSFLVAAFNSKLKFDENRYDEQDSCLNEYDLDDLVVAGCW